MRQRIVTVHLDDRNLPARDPHHLHERRIAIFDLIEENSFSLVEGGDGPYALRLRVEDGRLHFDVRTPEERPLAAFALSLVGLRGLLRDYFVVCDSYYRAIKSLSPSQIEAIDVGRRSLHNEGAEWVRDQLAARAVIDDATARRLFTLICALQRRG